VYVPGSDPFGPRSPIVGTVLPWRVAQRLAACPSGLYEVVWREEHDAGRLDVVRHEGPWVDCGRPADLLQANLEALRGTSVIDPTASVTGAVHTSAVGAGSIVTGSVRESVVFAGASVRADEVLDRCLRWLDDQGTPRTVQG
jgi:NDP-sugar pyrophosphorylase family protein